MINKAILVGRVGKDVEVKQFDGGVKVASFSLATSERAYTTRSGIDVPERTDWHNISIPGKLAEVAEKWVKKGDLIYVEGKIRNNSYQTQAGETKYYSEVRVNTLKMLGGNRDAKPQENNTPPVSSAGEGDDDSLPF